MPIVSAWNRVSNTVLAPEIGAARFETAGRIKTHVKEASDVVALPDGRLLTVGDMSDKVILVDANGNRSELKLDGIKNGKSQLEAVTYNPIKKQLFVAREEKGELLRYSWDSSGSAQPVLDKTFKILRDKNKGVEGLSYLRQELSPTQRAQLVVAKEGSPSQIYLRDDSGKNDEVEVKLEKEVLQACRDFSGVTVDPKTGNLFICSDKSSACAQVKLVREGNTIKGKLVQAFPLRDDEGQPLQRVEGVCFNAKGDLFVLTENNGELRHLKRK
jgi:uncharacterized protein YjiK